MNEQLPMFPAHFTDGGLEIHSMFETIQGEGPFAGQRAFFVRLYGCNLQCPWCDTDYTSTKEQWDLESLVSQLTGLESRVSLIVFTGGEPFRQPLTPIVKRLIEQYNYRVQIETNGVFYPGDDFPWIHRNVTVVVSPKTAKIHPKLAYKAHAYKYVLNYDHIAEDGLPISALEHPLPDGKQVARPPKEYRGPIYIQPQDMSMDQSLSAYAVHAYNKRNLEAVAESVMKGNGKYIMGVQMHKLVDLP